MEGAEFFKQLKQIRDMLDVILGDDVRDMIDAILGDDVSEDERKVIINLLKERLK